MTAYAVIAGGGTAGHVVPALAIGEALVSRGHDRSTIHFVGSRRGIDRRLVTPAGFPLTLMPGRGISRRITVDNIAALAGLAVAVVLALALLLRIRPRVVVSMGGYAAAPCGLVAALLRIPLVLSEQNAVPTATHRLLARFATASAIPFEGTPLPNPTVTGNPIRDEVASVDAGPVGRRAARRELGLPEEGVVLAAMGGSLGSRTINEAVLALAERWSGRDGIAIRHAVGERDWDSVSSRAPAPVKDGLVYAPVKYEERMPALLAAADVVIARAGASTVSEIACIGRAAILVPLPIAPFDHQAANAQVLVRAGAAVMLRDHEVTIDRLEAELDALLGDPARLRAMGEAARTAAHPDAADNVAALVERVAARTA